MDIEYYEPTDANLAVDNMIFRVHKTILAQKSSYFRSLFNEVFRNGNYNEIELKNISSQHFDIVLKYFYEDTINFHNLSQKDLVHVLQLAQHYELGALRQSILQHIIDEILNLDNVMFYLSWSEFLMLKSLEEVCVKIINNNSEVILDHPSLLEVPKSIAIKIFSSDYFYEHELNIFHSICSWIDAHKEEQGASDLLSCVRLPIISKTDLLNTVRPTNRFSPCELSRALENTDATVNFRAKNVPEVDVATSFGYRKLHRNNEKTVYEKNNSLVEGFVTTTVFELRKRFLINNIKLRFSKAQECSSNFSIDVSPDNISWHKAPVIRVSSTEDQLEFFTVGPIITKYIRVEGRFPVKKTPADRKHPRNFSIQCKYTQRTTVEITDLRKNNHG